MDKINAIFNVIDNNLACIKSNMDYDRITDSIIALCDAINATETDESTWYLGEFGMFTLADLIEGAYWHYCEWHGGQNSKGYLALCALGSIFSPGMTEPDPENIAYHLLDAIGGY